MESKSNLFLETLPVLLSKKWCNGVRLVRRIRTTFHLRCLLHFQGQVYLRVASVKNLKRDCNFISTFFRHINFNEGNPAKKSADFDVQATNEIFDDSYFHNKNKHYMSVVNPQDDNPEAAFTTTPADIDAFFGINPVNDSAENITNTRRWSFTDNQIEPNAPPLELLINDVDAPSTSKN